LFVLLFTYPVGQAATLVESSGLSNGFLKLSLAMPVPTEKTGKNHERPMYLPRENQANGAMREIFTQMREFHASVKKLFTSSPLTE